MTEEKENVVPMRNDLDRLCAVPCIAYQLKDIGVFKNYGTTRIGGFADELKDAFPEYKGNIVCGNRHATHADSNVCPQNIGVQFEFSLLNAIQERKTEADILKQEVPLLYTFQ